LVRTLDLRDVIIMGQDWGGPIGIGTALAVPERVGGLVFGNTWFWPDVPLSTRIFSWVMSTSAMQRAIVERNFFVEQLLPAGTARRLSEAEMEVYRRVQPSPQARRGVAEFPRRIVASAPWLATLAEAVPRVLGEKPLLLVWGMRDRAFTPGKCLPRWRASFRDVVVVELPRAKHFIQEDEPESIASAIVARYATVPVAKGSPAHAPSPSA
jgi:haloalkane dehalogenase